MIEVIQQLVQLLSQEGLTIEDVISRVGTVINDPGGLMPIELRPKLTGVQTASLSRDPDTEEPYELTIDPGNDVRLTARILKHAFGDFKRLRTDRGHPPQIIFYPPSEVSGWKVAVLATLQSAMEAFEDQQVISLSLRRDKSS